MSLVAESHLYGWRIIVIEVPSKRNQANDLYKCAAV